MSDRPRVDRPSVDKLCPRDKLANRPPSIGDTPISSVPTYESHAGIGSLFKNWPFLASRFGRPNCLFVCPSTGNDLRLLEVPRDPLARVFNRDDWWRLGGWHIWIPWALIGRIPDLFYRRRLQSSPSRPITLRSGLISSANSRHVDLSQDRPAVSELLLNRGLDRSAATSQGAERSDRMGPVRIAVARLGEPQPC